MATHWRRNLSIFGLYSLITVIVTYPAVTGLIYAYTIPGGFHDSFYFLWHEWWFKHALLNLEISPTFTKEIFHPTGGVLLITTLFNELASIALQPLLGLTRTHTFLALFSFPAAAFTTYLLAYYLTRNRWAAFVGGLIFSFSARHYAHSGEHLGLWTIQWLPLYTLALFFLLNKPSLKTSVFAALSFALAVMSDHVYYLFYFILPVTGLFIIYHGLAGHPVLRRGRFWLMFGSAMVIGMVLVSPIYWQLLQNSQGELLKEKGLLFFSPDITAYFTPARLHPVWHPLVEPLYEKINKHPVEGTTFIGYTAMGLAAIGLTLRPAKLITFWLLFGLLAFVFSLGPILYFYGPVEFQLDPDTKASVILPYTLLNYIPYFNLLRAPARLSIAVQLAVAMLAAYGLAAIAKRRPGKWQPAGYLAIAVFILFETLFQFPYPVESAQLVPPPIYRQIAGEKNGLAVLEIPLRKKYNPADPIGSLNLRWVYQYMYYATIHQHPLLGGATARTPQSPIDFLDTTAFIRELAHPAELTYNFPDVLPVNPNQMLNQGAQSLARQNIGYVIVHLDLLAEQIDPPQQQLFISMLGQALGNPFYNDGQILGFRVPPAAKAAPPQSETILWGNGWYPREFNPYQRPVRRMGQTGALLIYQPEPGAKQLSITAVARGSNSAAGIIKVNNIVVDTFAMPPAFSEPETHLTPAFPLVAGFNQITFHIDPANPSSEQKAGLAVYNITLTPASETENVSPTVQQ